MFSRVLLSKRLFSTRGILRDHGFKSVGVIGAGQMGMGIALVAARNAKLPVHILDANPEQLRKGLALVGR